MKANGDPLQLMLDGDFDAALAVKFNPNHGPDGRFSSGGGRSSSDRPHLTQQMIDDVAGAISRGNHSAYGIMRTGSLSQARQWANSANRPSFVHHGDDKRYWVAPGRTSEILSKLGYERVSE